MAIVDDTAPPKKEPSILLYVALLAGLTVVALGIGWGSGAYLGNQQTPHVPAADDAAAPAKAVETNLVDSHQALGIVYLEPITTNLAGPTGTWVRLELALIFDGEADPAMAQTIQQDMLGYMRTVKIHQIEGASGFQHLKSDLEERASIRSDGKVKGILIRTLLFE